MLIVIAFPIERCPKKMQGFFQIVRKRQQRLPKGKLGGADDNFNQTSCTAYPNKIDNPCLAYYAKQGFC